MTDTNNDELNINADNNTAGAPEKEPHAQNASTQAGSIHESQSEHANNNANSNDDTKIIEPASSHADKSTDETIELKPAETTSNEAPTEVISNNDDKLGRDEVKTESLPLKNENNPLSDNRPPLEFGAYASPVNNNAEQPVAGVSPLVQNNNGSNQMPPVNSVNNAIPGTPIPPLPPTIVPHDNNNANTPSFMNPIGSETGKPATTGTVIVSSLITGFVSILLTAGLVSSGAIGMRSADINSIDSSNTTNSNGSTSSGDTSSTDWSSVNKKVASSVVSIQTQLNNGVAAGSGAVIDADNGYIITNNHVVESAQTIYVTLSNGQIYEGELKGADATTDIAVVKLKTVPKNLTAIQFADSDSLAVGESAMAIGNPLGYSNSASTGIISALNRPVSVSSGRSNGNNNNSNNASSNLIVTNAIQIDAAINQGNSGGPLFNADGKVIGITSSIASLSNNSQNAGSIGIGFAIPSNLVKKVSDTIIQNGSFTHGQLGVQVQTNTVKADNIMRNGAQVKNVTSGGAADKAGLKVNDTIVAYNNHSVDSVESLLGYVRASSAGDKETLTIVRNNAVMNIDITLDKATADTTVSSNNGNENNDNNNNGFKDQIEGDNGDDLFNYLFGQGQQ